ncbi:MAG TPA: hypothetical protein VNO17_01570 [Actinomycetota bacterium]|nr:hypothetical protein [Actinomycetota bacterium]
MTARRCSLVYCGCGMVAAAEQLADQLASGEADPAEVAEVLELWAQEAEDGYREEAVS